MTAHRYSFLGFPVSPTRARQMADQLTFRDNTAPLGAQHVIRRRTERYVAVGGAS